MIIFGRTKIAMNMERPERGNLSPRNNTRILAIVGVSVGVGLLLFGTPGGFPPLFGPAAGALWPVVAIVCLILGLIGLTSGFDTRWRREEEPSARDAQVKSDQSPSEGIEAKLRQLLRLKEEKLISEEEYNRKRAEVLEKW
jgi:hypothetical protein